MMINEELQEFRDELKEDRELIRENWSTLPQESKDHIIETYRNFNEMYRVALSDRTRRTTVHVSRKQQLTLEIVWLVLDAGVATTL